VTGSHVHCKSGNILEKVQDRDAIIKGHEWEVIYGLLNSSNFTDLEWRSFNYCKPFQVRLLYNSVDVAHCNSWASCYLLYRRWM